VRAFWLQRGLVNGDHPALLSVLLQGMATARGADLLLAHNVQGVNVAAIRDLTEPVIR
jgi:hypothetical protein